MDGLISPTNIHGRYLFDHALAVVGEARDQLDLLRQLEQQRLPLPLQLVHLIPRVC